MTQRKNIKYESYRAGDKPQYKSCYAQCDNADVPRLMQIIRQALHLL